SSAARAARFPMLHPRLALRVWLHRLRDLRLLRGRAEGLATDVSGDGLAKIARPVAIALTSDVRVVHGDAEAARASLLSERGARAPCRASAVRRDPRDVRHDPRAHLAVTRRARDDRSRCAPSARERAPPPHELPGAFEGSGQAPRS